MESYAKVLRVVVSSHLFVCLFTSKLQLLSPIYLLKLKLKYVCWTNPWKMRMIWVARQLFHYKMCYLLISLFISQHILRQDALFLKTTFVIDKVQAFILLENVYSFWNIWFVQSDCIRNRHSFNVTLSILNLKTVRTFKITMIMINSNLFYY